MVIDSAKYSCAAGHDINEDSCLCSAERGIFIVADGLGGHSDGEKASLAAVDYFEENCLGGYTSKRIKELMEGANTEVFQKGDGGKTTVAAAFTENCNFIYANAGDSRIYYFRDGKIIAQTKDHSVCQASVDMGMMRFEDIRGNENRSRLLKVLGSEEYLNIKKLYPPIRIQNGDAFLICSDGFWEYVYETEMEADLLKSDSSEMWLKHMLKRHILRAENKGDNYTAICGIIYLDGSEVYIPPDSDDEQEACAADIPKKKNGTLLPIVVISVLLIAAAIVLSVFLKDRSEEDDTAEITTTNLVSETAECKETPSDETNTTTNSVSETDAFESAEISAEETDGETNTENQDTFTDEKKNTETETDTTMNSVSETDAFESAETSAEDTDGETITENQDTFTDEKIP